MQFGGATPRFVSRRFDCYPHRVRLGHSSRLMHRSATLYLSIVGFAALGILFILHAGDRLSRPAVPPGNNSQTEIGSPAIPPAGVSLSDSIEKRLELNAENPLSRFFREPTLACAADDYGNYHIVLLLCHTRAPSFG